MIPTMMNVAGVYYTCAKSTNKHQVHDEKAYKFYCNQLQNFDPIFIVNTIHVLHVATYVVKDWIMAETMVP